MNYINDKKTTLFKVKKALKIIRPFLKEDGGDVAINNLTKDNVLIVKLLGNCKLCPINKITLQVGIKAIIKREVPEIIGVRLKI